MITPACQSPRATVADVEVDGRKPSRPIHADAVYSSTSSLGFCGSASLGITNVPSTEVNPVEAFGEEVKFSARRLRTLLVLMV